ncbi:hypothetical protein Q8A67_004874 [Cirrhinus molitorella]|uniref:Uncharacterized protein n=1 Tax=Cirrhinus molitorella TaxID=172907 RepID=A0AA88QDJ6_9TELE|nr:hypothetical protein Q8A67_004874 [Cirrhinus molitorella]
MTSANWVTWSKNTHLVTSCKPSCKDRRENKDGEKRDVCVCVRIHRPLYLHSKSGSFRTTCITKMTLKDG